MKFKKKNKYISLVPFSQKKKTQNPSTILKRQHDANCRLPILRDDGGKLLVVEIMLPKVAAPTDDENRR